jgi:hypothetical protein
MNNLHGYILLVHVSRDEVIVVVGVYGCLIQDHVLIVSFLKVTWDEHYIVLPDFIRAFQHR